MKKRPNQAYLQIMGMEERTMLSASPVAASDSLVRTVDNTSNAIANLGNQKIVAYDVTTTGKLDFNSYTGSYYPEIEITNRPKHSRSRSRSTTGIVGAV